MSTEVEIRQNVDPPQLLKSRLAALCEATDAGDEALIESLRGTVIQAVRGAAKHYERLEMLEKEAKLLAAIMANPEDRKSVKELAELTESVRVLPVIEAASEIDEPPPPPLFRVHESRGVLWPMGEVAVLSGEGGTGKSTVAGELALSVAAHPSGNIVEGGEHDSYTRTHQLPLVPCRGGPVLWLAYEERKGLLAKRLRVRSRDLGIPEAASRIFVLNLAGDDDGSLPLFGPGERNGASGLYNARPERLAGWDAMLKGIKDIPERAGERPALIVVDPSLSAYVGEANNVAPVREFVNGLVTLADREDLAVLLVSHATKEDIDGPFDRRLIAGSAAWTDGVRCAMTLSFGDGSGEPNQDARTLAVIKANTGPSKIWTVVSPVRRGDSSGWIVGYERNHTGAWLHKNQWQSEKQAKNQTPQKGRKARPKKNGEDLFASAGESNGPGAGASGRKNGGEQGSPESGVGNGSGDDSFAA